MTSKDRFATLASELDIPGRSSMTKAELEAAVLDRLDSTDIARVLKDYKVDLSDDVSPFVGADADGDPVEEPEPVSEEVAMEQAASFETVGKDDPEAAREEAFVVDEPDEADAVPEQDENAEAEDES